MKKISFCFLSMLFICSNHKFVYSQAQLRSNYLEIPKEFKRVGKKYRRGNRWNSRTRFIRRDLKQVAVKSTPILLDPTILQRNITTHKEFLFKLSEAKFLDDPRVSFSNSLSFNNAPFGQASWPEIAANIYIKDGKVYSKYKGYTLLLTLNSSLQEASESFLISSHLLDGATTIIEPKTGRILALAQKGGSRNAEASVSAKAPAASLMKIITSAAVIEKEKLDPYESFFFRGGCGHLSNENWIADNQRDRQSITFAKAFGMSCNTVFGRLALYHAGLSSLREYGERFMFNKPIPSDIKIQTSLFLLPDLQTATSQEVAEAGAGFGATKLSPIHAALISATVSNSGIMMAPYLIEAAYDSHGKEVYRGRPHQIGYVISKETAHKIETLMLATISSGTSRKAFRKRGTRGEIGEIGGKTGTLLDPERRDILYTWFSGIAPLNSPNSIAIGTVVESFQNWVVRASSVAQTTLAEYLKLERNNEI